MANVQHASLTGADLHEPKGAATATVGTYYVSNGAASGTWKTLSAHGGLHAIATSMTPTWSSWNPLTIATTGSGSSANVTEGATNRLTYTGTETRRFLVNCRGYLSFYAGSTGGVPYAITSAYVYLYKNGSAVTGTQFYTTGSSATMYLSFDISRHLELATNDYVELYYYGTATGTGTTVLRSISAVTGYPYHFNIQAL